MMTTVTLAPGAPAVCRCGAQLAPVGHDGPAAYHECEACGAYVRVLRMAAESPSLFDDRTYAAPGGRGTQAGMF